MIKVFIIYLLIASCYGFRQELAIYTGLNFTGDSLNLRSKVADLVSFAPGIVLKAQSDCLIGHWIFYQDKDFLTNRSSIIVNTEWGCANNNSLIPYTASARFLGPEDTDTDSISFYSQPSFVGEEVIIAQEAYPNISFTPRSIFSTGNSSWILYTGINFTGEAVCYTPTYSFHYVAQINGTSSIKSVLKDCNSRLSRIDRHISPPDHSPFTRLFNYNQLILSPNN